MGQLITNWVTNGGIAAVFVLMVVNQCGIPFPSEVTMPLAGYFASTGHLNVVGVVVAGSLGALVGALIAYTLSRLFGERLLLGPGRHIGISKSHLELSQRAFSRFGYPLVFFGRFLPVFTTYVSFPAGLHRVNPVGFAVLSLAGAAIWCSALTAAGYAIGANYDKVSGPIGKAAIVLAVLIVVALVVWYVRGRRARAARTA
ncbi:MAG: DedA family protein [Candidatus Dormibacteraeota bacterium]|nr:DedA family protein [Candidatus Dormibacteraeota bacterium]MBV8446134.1 DedA family protein [Candidatus Dormibacteraeota bacterium]